jgi:hypothetical protein
MTKAEDTHSLDQARAQFESIKELVDALNQANESEDYDAVDDARKRIYEDALSVEVRSGWYLPGSSDKDARAPEEYRILLCTGGPAVQIVGKLNDYGEPETAELQHQDWFKPWTRFPTSLADEEILLSYARCFYFGE